MTTKTLTGLIAGTVLAATLALPLSFAAASSDSSALDGATLGKTTDEIKATLTGLGYEVRKVKPEDGALEAYAVKDGKKYEIYVDPASGAVTKVSGED